MHPAWIEIDLVQFQKNIATVKKAIGKALLCLPIKANAYGHGLIKMAQAATKAQVDYLAVAHVQEGISLREANIATPIIVLGAIHEDQMAELLHYDLEFTLSSPYKARFVSQWCAQYEKIARVHLEVDTGMRRTGMRTATVLQLCDELNENTWIDVVGIYSHLATGNSPTDTVALKQIEEFSSMLLAPQFRQKNLIRPLANSSADEGDGIGYGHTHVAKARTRIVTIPVGYGDGFKRALSNRGAVLINGRRYPIVGTVCMDQFMVDVGNDSVYVGDEVVLIGRQGDLAISVAEVAALCDTIPYEVLCLFNDRLPRKYIEEENGQNIR